MEFLLKHMVFCSKQSICLNILVPSIFAAGEISKERNLFKKTKLFVFVSGLYLLHSSVDLDKVPRHADQPCTHGSRTTNKPNRIPG